MKTTTCFFCGSHAGFFPVHGILVCASCKSGVEADDPGEQDLFDEEEDYHPEISLILSDLLLQAS
jgi:hypothetical protein